MSLFSVLGGEDRPVKRKMEKLGVEGKLGVCKILKSVGRVFQKDVLH